MFPEPAKALSAETLPYSQVLHAGVENDTFYLRGRFGVDFHLIGYRFGEGGSIDTQSDQVDRRGKDILFGINAAAHINMRPTSGMRFPVDNFYALLALHFSGALSERLSWRLYPVHHVSAHLADGHKSDTAVYIPIPADSRPNDTVAAKVGMGVRPVSAEMARGEIYWKPLGEVAEFGAGFGYYYHVCLREGPVYRADLSVLLQPPAPYRVFGGALSPYALARLENVRQGGNNFGATASAGAVLRKSGRGFGLSIIYFDKLHSGYYFEKYEKGAGAECMFLF